MNKKFLKLLNEINSDESELSTFDKNDRVMIIDGLNLFLRNFAMINYVNQSGNHVGGLGGFLRSLSSLIYLIKPTSVYVVFDGKGSSDSRKNLLPEYKSGRNVTRVTNWEIFKNIGEENDAKINQIVRLIQYLQCLPVKTISMEKVEADDVIAYLSTELSNKYNSKVFIVSADQDYTQLVSENITAYRPTKKEFYTPDKVLKEYGVNPENFIIFKTLVGDTSDKMSGVKGLGKGKLFKFFPELEKDKLSLEDIYNIGVKKHKDHVIYARIVSEYETLKKQYKIMDLKNPLLDENEKEILEEFMKDQSQTLKAKEFLQLYKDDGLGNQIIKDPSYWLRETFKTINILKNK